MDFTLPTTKQELTETLKEIDVYYRQYKGEYEEHPLEELSLDKLTFLEKTESAIRAELSAVLDRKEETEIAERCAAYKAEYKKNEALYNADDGETARLLAKAEEEYERKLARLNAEAARRNIGQSSAYMKLLAELEEEYGKKTEEIEAKAADRKAGYLRAMTLAEYAMEEVAAFAEKKYLAELEEKTQARLKEQKEYSDAITKYNNQIEEKLVKSRNDVAKTESSLKLQYLDITSKGLTDDELKQLGYFKDTIRAVDGYYYTLTPAAAFDDFSADSSMPYYLGPYYSDILYKYTLRKNNA